MSTSETDFWTRVDSEPSREDDSESPQPSGHGANANGSNPRKGSPEPAAPQGAAASKKPESESAAEVARPVDRGAGKSKSQRIREYLAAHPEARNRDAVDALSSYGVTGADVSNVRTQLRKKAEKQQNAKARVQPNAARAPHTEPVPRRTAAPAPAATPAASEVAMGEIEAGLAFVESVGGLQRARQVIDLIARIREVNLG